MKDSTWMPFFMLKTLVSWSMSTFVIFQLKTTHGGCFPLRKMSSWSIRLQTGVQVRWSKPTFMCVRNIVSLSDLNAAGGSPMSLDKVGPQGMVLWSSGGLVLQASAICVVLHWSGSHFGSKLHPPFSVWAHNFRWFFSATDSESAWLLLGVSS